MDRVLGIVVGGIIAAVLLAVPLVLFGGLLISALLALLAIPIGFPVTTLTLSGVFVVAFAVRRLRRRRQTPGSNDHGA